MKVTEVTVSAKYSLDTGHGWKAIEVGATATLTASTESLESVQAELYQRLGKQLKTLWANGNGKDSGQAEGSSRQVGIGEGHQMDAQPAQPVPITSGPPADRPNFCVEHNQEWKKRTGPHGEFYSHQIKGTNPQQWCNSKK